MTGPNRRGMFGSGMSKSNKGVTAPSWLRSLVLTPLQCKSGDIALKQAKARAPITDGHPLIDPPFLFQYRLFH